MQFFLTDIGVGLAALLGYWSFGRLARRRAPVMFTGRRGVSSARAGYSAAREIRLLRRKPAPRKPGVPPEFLTVDPKRLVRLW